MRYPNARNISENVSSVRFYKNLGTNSNPTFTYVSSNLFQSDMIEHGTGSIPVLTDYDQDGKQDLFVGNFFRYKATLDRESTIAYYRNTGTVSAPQFTFVDNNFLNLNQLGLGLRLVPTFGDIDNDNDPDMLIGLDNGTIAYFQNIGSMGSPSFAAPVFNFTDNTGATISVGSYAYPQLFDLNKDNLLDLVIGRKNGQISYYENTGSASSPEFTLITHSLGNVNVASSIPDGYSSPHFIRVNDTTKLFIGNYDGNILFYDSIDNHLYDGVDFHLVSGSYSGINVEGYSAITTFDLDNDGELNAIVGQDLGGLFAYEGDPNSNASIPTMVKELNFICYPNPTNNEVTIEADFIIHEIILYALNGRLIEAREVLDAKAIIDLGALSQGIYIVQVKDQFERVRTERITKM